MDRARWDDDFLAVNERLYQPSADVRRIDGQRVNHLLDPSKYWWIAVLSDLWKEVGWERSFTWQVCRGSIQRFMKPHESMVPAS